MMLFFALPSMCGLVDLCAWGLPSTVPGDWSCFASCSLRLWSLSWLRLALQLLALDLLSPLLRQSLALDRRSLALGRQSVALERRSVVLLLQSPEFERPPLPPPRAGQSRWWCSPAAMLVPPRQSLELGRRSPVPLVPGRSLVPAPAAARLSLVVVLGLRSVVLPRRSVRLWRRSQVLGRRSLVLLWVSRVAAGLSWCMWLSWHSERDDTLLVTGSGELGVWMVERNCAMLWRP